MIEFAEAALMKLKLITVDVGSAYIQEFTREIIFAIAGTEFRKCEGLKIIIDKVIYGLNLSGEMWHLKSAKKSEESEISPLLIWFQSMDARQGRTLVICGSYGWWSIFFSQDPDMIIDPLK